MKAASAAKREEIERLVAECLDVMEAEGGSAVEEFLGRNAEHAPAIRSRLERLQDAGLLEAPPSAEPRFPERLGAFRLIERIGGGGMGVVYLAEQEPLGRKVALKLVRPDLLYFEGARERFRREVEAAARLQHPGIVPIYTVGEEEGVPYYAMEHVAGKSLDEVLGELRGRRPERLSGRDLLAAVEEARDSDATAAETQRSLASASWVDACLQVALQVALALDHAHRRGVLHRDLKPSNVLLAHDGRALLFDFGLACTRGTTKLTRTGSQVGSLPYMAPEQLRGEESDERTDLYALGVTLYELLALHLPYLAQDPEETRRRILEGAAAPIRAANPAVPWDVETVALTAMEHGRARRYPSASALAEDLRALLEHRTIAARRPGALLRARRFVQRNPTWSTGAALGVLLMAGSIAFGVRQHVVSRELARANLVKDAALAELSAANGEKEAALVAERAGYRRALGAANEMLRRVGGQELDDVPGAEPVRRALLDEASALYDELLAEQPADPELRREAAVGFTMQSDLLRELGEPERALAAARRSAELLEGLRAQTPDEPRVLHALAGAWSGVASACEDLGDQEERARCHGLSAAILEELVGQLEAKGAAPSDVQSARWLLVNQRANVAVLLEETTARKAEALELLQENERTLEALLGETRGGAQPAPELASRLRGTLVKNCLNLGLILAELGRNVDAQAVLEQGLALAEAMCAESPDDRTSAERVAGFHANLSWVLWRLERRPEAVAAVTEAARRAGELSRLFPANAEYRERHVSLVVQRGSFLCGTTGRRDEATAAQEEAVLLADELLNDFPGRLGAWNLHVRSLGSLGRHLVCVERTQEACDLLRFAHERSAELRRRWPGEVDERDEGPIVASHLAEALLELGELAEARAFAERSIADKVLMNSREREIELAQTLTVLAEITARQGDHAATARACGRILELSANPEDDRHAAGLAASVHSALAGEDPLAAAASHELALALLERALAHGYADSADLLSATDLDPLRADPRARALLAHLASGAGG